MGATKVFKVNSALPEPDKIAEAARIVRQGGVPESELKEYLG